MPEVVHFDGCINAELDRLLNDGTVLACDEQSDILTWRDIIGESPSLKRLLELRED